MRRILLVTTREYLRMTGLPAFWIFALIVPVFVGVGRPLRIHQPVKRVTRTGWKRNSS